jgi:class 3 adenylate cyclase
MRSSRRPCLGLVVLYSRLAGRVTATSAVFDRASAAVAAAVSIQRRVAAARRSCEPAIAVRIAVHTGGPLFVTMTTSVPW